MFADGYEMRRQLTRKIKRAVVVTALTLTVYHLCSWFKQRLYLINNLTIEKRSIHLITQWYTPADPDRLLELVRVLKLNLLNPYIEAIHLLQPSEPENNMSSIGFSHASFLTTLSQDPSFPTATFYKKTIIVNSKLKGRLLASKALQYASMHLPFQICILANLDIYFDESISLLHSPEADLSSFTSYFLSRYEEPEMEPFSLIGTQCGEKFQGSHDAIVFIPPVPKQMIEHCTFALGSWGIESRLLWEFEQFGMTGRNPCFDIKSWHVHFNGTKDRWMPQVNIHGKSSIAFPDYLVSDIKPDYPWDIARWNAEYLERNQKKDKLAKLQELIKNRIINSTIVPKLLVT